MHRTIRLAFGITALGGSVLGLVVMVPALAVGSRLGFPLEYLLFCVFALYAYGIWAGVQALKNAENWRKFNSYFWLAQVPGLVTPSFAFLVSAAAGAWVYLRVFPSLGAGLSFYLGSGMQIAYAKATGVTLVGLNVVALSLALFLRFYRRSGAYGTPLTLNVRSRKMAELGTWLKSQRHRLENLFPTQYVPRAKAEATKSNLRRLSSSSLAAGILCFLGALFFESWAMAILAAIPMGLSRYYTYMSSLVVPESDTELSDPQRRHWLSIAARRVSTKHEEKDK